MHSLKIATLASIASVASVSAANCNPSYNTPSAGECFSNCNKKAGKELYSDWTDDSSSPNFLKSLSFMCNKGTSEYMAFMTTGGMCMVSCSNPELFSNEFASACSWWQEHKNDTCDANGQGNNRTTLPSKPENTQQPTEAKNTSSANGKMSPLNAQTCAVFFAGIATYFLI
ncbi:hypothetical protein BY458DRAFT_441181 [Sporodiniella umbellata]|nr:hypothetical protein BY458DRAFT_441181 [Sporodiniella umbellata]